MRCPAPKQLTMTQSVLKPRGLIGKWQAHQVQMARKSRK
jgi:hypothetical protein